MTCKQESTRLAATIALRAVASLYWDKNRESLPSFFGRRVEFAIGGR
jgi:hypothetical protein